MVEKIGKVLLTEMEAKSSKFDILVVYEKPKHNSHNYQDIIQKNSVYTYKKIGWFKDRCLDFYVSGATNSIRVYNATEKDIYNLSKNKKIKAIISANFVADELLISLQGICDNN